MKRGFPTLREGLLCVVVMALWAIVTALFIGFRPEHVLLAILIIGLFFASVPTRKLLVALIPFALFGISYDWMNLLPNYEVNPIDTLGLYSTEKALFGITTAGGVLTPNEWFAAHTCKAMDFMAGVFYLCWVPLPIFYGLWLYFTGKTRPYAHFAWVFLLVNLLGFTFYYIHPAAPPWYVARYGFEPILNTPGSVAGLGAFDAMTGTSIFHGIYERNANVFAALPSLHSAYTLVAFIYAFRARSSAAWKIILGVVTVGIWFTAVYTSHHYIIDVLAGITCALAGFILFEFVLMRIPAVERFMQAYARYISRKTQDS